MSHTLVFTLGRGIKTKDSTRYRTATYQFSDGYLSAESPFFGLCLLDWLRHQKSIEPSRLIILGTKGSIWDALVEAVPSAVDASELALAEALYPKVKSNSVAQEDLLELSSWCSKTFQVPCELRIIPEGVDYADQMRTLHTLAELVPSKSTLHMCVTHGLRHMPMLQMLSSFHLTQTNQIKIGELYYGALELGQNGQSCPVVELSGAADLQKWSLALNTLANTGRLSSLAEAARAGDAELAAALQKADDYLATNRIERAAVYAKKAASLIADRGLPGAGELFAKAAIGRLTWASQTHLWQKQRLLAMQALDCGDLMRSVILCQEAYISKRVAPGIAENDYEPRKDAWKQLLDNAYKQDRQCLRTLECLRNATAHGSTTDHQKAQILFSNPHELKEFLKVHLRKIEQLRVPH